MNSVLSKPTCIAVLAAIAVLGCGAPEDEPTAPSDDGLAEAARVVGSTVRLALDKTIYEPGEEVRASLELGGLDPGDEIMPVHVVSPSGDVELVVLRRVDPGAYLTEVSRAEIRVLGGDATPHDGVLDAGPGDALTALLFFDLERFDPGARIVAASAFVGGDLDPTDLPASTVVPGAVSAAERAAAEAGRPFGVIMAEGSLPVEIALGQVVFTPEGLYDLEAFLDASGGRVAANMTSGEDGEMTYLVNVPLEPARADILGLLRAFFGDDVHVIASQEDALRMFALILQFRMQGFAVSANPRLQLHGRFETQETDGSVLRAAMRLADRLDRACVADDETCPLNVQAMWAHMALWDFDTREIPVAFLDQGFTTASPDFRRPASGLPFSECDYAARCDGGDPLSCDLSPRCGAGVANAPPTVGASLFGERVWHGTGSVATAGGVLNNGWIPATADVGGSAGPGGQVVVPMLYRMDLGSYAFQMGDAIRRATDGGAACINIAAGYPCNVGLTLVGSIDLCDPGARGAVCAGLAAAVTAAAVAATTAACAVSGALGFLDLIFPGAGALAAAAACGAATTAGVAAVAAVNSACVALVALGDPRGPMQAGVDYASSRGVPIIASMGNQFTPENLPEELRPFVAPETFRFDGDQLRMVPAVLPPVISVGAAAGSPWRNRHLRGASVSVWAPEISTYLGPAIGAPVPTVAANFTQVHQHGGTSSASSFVTGVVASMQAADPTLNPRNTALTAAERRAIPARVASILAASATEMGSGPGEPARLPMINPLRALRSVADPTPTGFDRRLNFNERVPDSPTVPTLLPRGRPGLFLTGSIITARGTGGAATRRDRDYLFIRSPSRGPLGANSIVTLRFPERIAGRNMGRLELVGGGFTEVSRSESVSGSGATEVVIRVVRYRSPPLAEGEEAAFEVRGIGDDDNVYKLQVAHPPQVRIDAPEADQRFRQNQQIRLRGRATDPNDFFRALPDSAHEWTLADGTVLGSGPDLTLPRDRLAVGMHVIRLTARNGELLGQAEVTVVIEPATGDGDPTAFIDSPDNRFSALAARRDADGRWFLDLTLRGHGEDASGSRLPGSALRWSAIAPDGERRLLGTGESLDVALESLQPFGTSYRIFLRVEDSRGRVGEDSIVVILQHLS